MLLAVKLQQAHDADHDRVVWVAKLFDETRDAAEFERISEHGVEFFFGESFGFLRVLGCGCFFHSVSLPLG